MSQVKLTGGRSSVSGITATVFGAGGFLGKYVVNRLGKIGSRVKCPHRGDEVDVRHLKLAGDLGQVLPSITTIRSLGEIEKAVAGSNVVINLLGKHYETSRWSFHDAHVAFPGVLAQVCADMGVEKLVHVSALGAEVDSPSAWARSKALGEEAVRDGFPGATILRPATMFGDEDKFLNRIAKLSQTMPFYPVVDGATKQQPVYMDDVAHAVFVAATDPSAMGKTIELAGPKTYTNQELIDYVFKVIKEESNAIQLSKPVGYAFAYGMQQIPNPWMTVDGFRRQSVDLVLPEGVMGFDELGIDKLTTVEDVGERYLVRFRKMSVFVDEGEVVNAPR
jgi:NADH dehydrogenase (ubiquinone) 1 alpha subcomplex subunit 9